MPPGQNTSWMALNVTASPRSTYIVAGTAYKQPVQGDLDLPEYIEECKEITVACNFGGAYEKCLWNAILLGLRECKVYEKCITVRMNYLL